MPHELLLMEVRKSVDRVVTDQGQKIQIVLVRDFGQFLRDIDAPDVVRDEIRHIVAHPIVLHDGDHTGDKQCHGYRAEAQRQLHPHRELELLHSVRKFPKHFLTVCLTCKLTQKSRQKKSPASSTLPAECETILHCKTLKGYPLTI